MEEEVSAQNGRSRTAAIPSKFARSIERTARLKTLLRLIKRRNGTG
jgi:hypothetical protein